MARIELTFKHSAYVISLSDMYVVFMEEIYFKYHVHVCDC